MRALLCVTLLGASAVMAAPRMTLEQIMARPFASDLTAGPGDRLAWLINTRGVRNVWIAEPSGYEGRQLTKFTEDDGQEIGGIRWLPNGRGVVFVRGGDLATGRAELPNPLSRPEGVEQAIWLATLDGVVRKLADGASVEPLPGSDRILFTRSGQIWSTGLNEGDKPVSLVQLRGRFADLAAAPDGQAFAFVSHRAGHSFIGVYRFADKTLRYLDPSVDTDISPVWSPDSKRIAFIRIAAETGRVRFGPVRTAGEPWSIRVAGSNSGAGREVWKAEPGRGSAFHPLATKSLLWASGDRLVFPWERDGWLHLYSASAGGGAASLLTPGDFEVEHASLSAGGREVVYSSNQDDIDRRHIWRVAVHTGARPVALTSGTGIEWDPVALSNGAFAFLRSDARLPSRAAIHPKQGPERDLAPETIPRDFPLAELCEPQAVTFPAADGMLIHGQLFLPKAPPAPKGPALIFLHGGSRRQMLLGWHYMYYYNNAYALNQYLAWLGYVVLSVNYRSGIGYGLDFREAIGYGAAGASEYNDVIGAGLFLRARADVDPRRIGLWGGSYGGYLTALGLARASDLFAAGVDFHGVHDWSKLRSFETGSPEARSAFESSPVASVKTWRSPVLLIHGDDDRNVPFAETIRLVEALRAQKVDFEQLIFPDEVHDFLTHGHWIKAYAAAVDFFSRKLK
jgi:dipeptidyl aminopeptidase/acylaminoacyl peptidase